MMYILENKNLSICISNMGAELKSVKYKDEEYLHGGDEVYWHRSSPVLFPLVGRIKNNNYKYKNKKYTLPIHGFARFKKFSLIKSSANSLEFLLKEDKHTLKHYPFTFNLYIKYTLEDDSIKIDYKINSKQDIIFGFGTHPAFLLKANISDTYLEFEKQENQKAYKLDLKNGCIKNQEGEELKGNTLDLYKDIFSEDALIYKHLNSKSVSLKNTKNSKSVKVFFDGFDYLGIWAKVNAPYVCIEPWCSHADEINASHNIEEKEYFIKLDKNTDFLKSLKIQIS